MSRAVFCDVCDKVLKEGDCLECGELHIKGRPTIYSGHVCDECQKSFDHEYDYVRGGHILKEKVE